MQTAIKLAVYRMCMSEEPWHQPVRLVVNDRKFLDRTVFFSHTKPASSNNPRSYTIVSAPAEQAENQQWRTFSIQNILTGRTVQINSCVSCNLDSKKTQCDRHQKHFKI